MFKQLEQVWNAAEKEVDTLKKEVKELEQAKYRMEGALTYVESQLNTLRATPLATTPPNHVAPSVAASNAPPPVVADPLPNPLYPTLPPAPASVPVAASPTTGVAFPTPSDSEDIPAEPSRQGLKVVKIPDPLVFHASTEVKISY